MRKKLMSKMQSIDNQLDEMIASLGDYSHKELNTQVAPETWSVIQIMHHVFLSEKYSLEYCEKKLSFNPTLKEAGVLSKFRSWAVQAYLNSPFKFKAPTKIDASVLPLKGELDEISILWKEQRGVLKQFIVEISDDYITKEIYKHPAGGRLSLEGMLDFFQAHFNNHRKQIWRTLG